MIFASDMTNFLDIFEDQKIDKMDIISCHDPQVVECRKLFFYFTWIDFKYKEDHIPGLVLGIRTRDFLTGGRGANHITTLTCFLGLVGLIDAKGIDVAQPIWP